MSEYKIHVYVDYENLLSLEQGKMFYASPKEYKFADEVYHVELPVKCVIGKGKSGKHALTLQP